MGIQSEASVREKWCAALFRWRRGEGFLFWRGSLIDIRDDLRLGGRKRCSAAQAKWHTKPGITGAETPQRKSGESIQYKEAVKKERWQKDAEGAWRGAVL